MLARVTRTDATTYGPIVGFLSDNAGAASNWVGVVYFSNGTFLVANTSGGTIQPPGTLAAGSYWALAILSTTSSFAYLSFDEGLTFKLLGVNTRTSDPVYATISNYSAPWQIARATVFLTTPRSPVISTTVAVTPTVGPAELLTNGNMETGDPPTSWITNVTFPATLTANADARGGAQSIQIARNGVNSFQAQQSVAGTAGVWYRFAAWGKKNDATYFYLVMRTFADGANLYSSTTYENVNFTEQTGVARATDAGIIAILKGYSPGADGVSVRFDDASLMALTTITTLAGDAGTKEGVFDFAPATVSAGYQGGGDCCADAGGTYYLRAWIDRTAGTVNLLKCVNGTQTSLVSSATGVTYGAARNVRVVICAPAGLATASVGVYYESAAGVFTLIGTIQTVDLTSFGTLVNGFSTENMNVVVTVQTGGLASELGVPA